MNTRVLFFLVSPILFIGVVSLFFLRPHAPVDFEADVRPMLNAKCLKCHGGVRQNGGFSLLFPEEALQAGESGRPAIVPGHADSSEIMRRVRHHDPEERMPYEADPLSKEEINVLEKWIDEGAAFGTHWAFVPPDQDIEPPPVRSNWVRKGIDSFVLQRLMQEGLAPSPEASCYTLLRRASLDLTGLPPTPSDADAFCADDSPDAFETAVDQLLSSPHYGEHMAAQWLDLARYADTKGYRPDLHREIYRYRDWVIEAFNNDMPFDQFTIEQLAGDLLEAPTDHQMIATAFHRNTMTNDEGGTDDREFRVAAVIDRVNTTFEVWQGLTVSCVQCHAHPYDPIRHEEYYGLYAFFNNTTDFDRYDDWPRWPTFSHHQKATLDSLLQEIEGERQLPPTGSIKERRKAALHPLLEPASANSTGNVEFWNGTGLRILDTGTTLTFTDVALDGVESIRLTYQGQQASGRVEARLADGRRIGRATLRGQREQTDLAVPVSTVSGRHDLTLSFHSSDEDTNFSLNLGLVSLDGPVRVLPAQSALLDIRPVETPIMQELAPDHSRVTTVFQRGNWLSPGDTVEAFVPSALPALPPTMPQSRLGLAQWLMDDGNPLTARVTVNRVWAQLFGTGIVETLEDFGTQGSRPTHPELLDWLAVRFMNDHEWRFKALLKELVTSATYRQQAVLPQKLNEKDPANLLLARSTRLRLSAEAIRDQGLHVSGLLNDEMYGPSVMPVQPPGIWSVQLRPHIQWQNSEGDDRYRRALYTYWRRSSPYPSMITFDSPSREVCLSRRVPTNTPLQAFVTLNDPVYVEMAQALAGRMAAEGGDSPWEQLEYGYRLALIRPPDEATMETLSTLYNEALTHYQSQPSDTLAEVAGAAYNATPSQAALVQTASALMNLDAYITR